MITLQDVQFELKELTSKKITEHSEKEWKRYGKRAKLLTECQYYLETSPSSSPYSILNHYNDLITMKTRWV